MKRSNLIKTLLWVARIWGGIILMIVLIALIQSLIIRKFSLEFKSISLFIGLILGLSIAYKWELIGGIIATLGIVLSGFVHPFVFSPALLYIIYWFFKKSLKT